ncbi:MAG: hypothetical protein WCJ58_00660 [bacterium]
MDRDKVERYLKNYKCFDDNQSEEKIMEWLKTKISEGKYPNLKNYTQEQLEKYVRFIKPYINIQLRTANNIVKGRISEKLLNDLKESVLRVKSKQKN